MVFQSPSAVVLRSSSLTVQYDLLTHTYFPFSFVKSNDLLKCLPICYKCRDRQAPTLHWELERPDSSSIEGASLSRLAQKSNPIVALSLHSNTHLLPPFVNWTLSLLYTHFSLTASHLLFSHSPRKYGELYCLSSLMLCLTLTG